MQIKFFNITQEFEINKFLLRLEENECDYEVYYYEVGNELIVVIEYFE